MIKGIVFDFDGIFTDNTVLCGPMGEEFVLCSRADSLGVARCAEAGIKLFVLSSENAPVVATRSTKMGIKYRKGIKDKLTALKSWLKSNDLDPHEIIYVGNDVNDCTCLEHVGIGIVTPDAHLDAVAVSDYQTLAPGGNGAVREVCDKVLNGEFENVFGGDNTS